MFGAGGRMGSTVCSAVAADPELELVAAVDPYHEGIELRQLGVDAPGLTVARSAEALEHNDVEVAVDFTVVDAARANLEWCADHGVHAVVGTTGFSDDDLADLTKRFESSDANAVIAPNFAIGAVLMMRFAELAAPYFETAEVIELHHDEKVDAPSGTAMLTAQRMAAASDDWGDDPTEKLVVEGARGADGPGGSACTRSDSEGSSRTRKWCSERPASRSASATTPTTGRRSCPACCSRSAASGSGAVSRSASTPSSGSR